MQLLVVGLLVLAGCLAAGPSDPPAAQSGPSDADLALIAAARRGDAEAVRRQLAQGASVAASDASGATALIAAAYGNHLDVARLLIAAGADVNVQDNTRQSVWGA